MSDLGTLALEDTPRIDFGQLRDQRRARLLEAMDRHDLDLLLLGREANARYASGARRLWTAGTRPFAPGCVVVRATGAVHLLSTWDDGIPAEIPRQHLFGVTWNPANLASEARAASGGDARRIGVDSMTPLFAGLLSSAFPGSEIVDASPALWSVRSTKLPGEVACIRTAIAVAESGLSCALDHLRPGVQESELRGAFAERISAFGVTVPGAEAEFRTTGGPTGPSADGALDQGRLVACSVSAMYAGYEGSLARTWLCAPLVTSAGEGRPSDEARGLHRRWEQVRRRLLEACRPGRDAGELRAAYLASGELLPPVPIAHGLGLGMEPPLVGSGLDSETASPWTLRPGTVLSIGAHVSSPGVGAVLAREAVLITDTGHEVLTTHAQGPLAG
ncbi:MAG TPA: M24 family peptidase [Acidimicrobiales bacterium]|nr:M24 family peptidase [Acidimicrobiales bacterium]